MIPRGMDLKALVTDVLNMGSRHWALVIILFQMPMHFQTEKGSRYSQEHDVKKKKYIQKKLTVMIFRRGNILHAIPLIDNTHQEW